MENNNDKSKTEKFTPMNKSNKPEINRSAGDAYSEARRTPEYDFYDGDDGGNKKLVVVSVILAVMLVIVIALSIFIIGSTKKGSPENEQPPVETEEIVEEDEEEEEKTGKYNLVFYGESIIEKNDYVIIDADLFDEEMTKVSNRKIKISSETRIISGGESITKKSLIYLIENVVDEKIVFEGTIQEEDGLALRLSFEYEAEPEPEEEIPEEPIEDEPAEEPADEPEQNPTENQGTPVE